MDNLGKEERFSMKSMKKHEVEEEVITMNANLSSFGEEDDQIQSTHSCCLNKQAILEESKPIPESKKGQNESENMKTKENNCYEIVAPSSTSQFTSSTLAGFEDKSLSKGEHESAQSSYSRYHQANAEIQRRGVRLQKILACSVFLYIFQF